MKSLTHYILEGGMSGHMSHPYDYGDLTLRDIKGLIRMLFEGRIEDITEKLDGTNIQVTKNTDDEVVFIRNKGDLNSAKGGMSIEDMYTKWKDKPSVAETFIKAGEILKETLKNIPVRFFNPDNSTRVTINCECIKQGQTNIIPYSNSIVSFHDLWIYKYQNGEWINTEVTKRGLETVENQCNKNAMVTPKLIVKTVDDSNKLLVSYIKEIDKIFKNNDCKEYSTVNDFKFNRFKEYCKDNYPWLLDEEGIYIVFNRWINGIKSVNIRVLKNIYKDYVDELIAIDKSIYKDILRYVISPLDSFFARLGNDIISFCDNMMNKNSESDSINILRKDLNDVISQVRSGDDSVLNDKLDIQLERLSKLGDRINASEGIVFNYKGKLMKLTGSFAALNQILGTIRFAKK